MNFPSRPERTESQVADIVRPSRPACGVAPGAVERARSRADSGSHLAAVAFPPNTTQTNSTMQLPALGRDHACRTELFGVGAISGRRWCGGGAPPVWPVVFSISSPWGVVCGQHMSHLPWDLGYRPISAILIVSCGQKYIWPSTQWAKILLTILSSSQLSVMAVTFYQFGFTS